jgi:hypothetical protein
MDTANTLPINLYGNVTISSNLEVGTANLFVDTTTGNVGVGTSSPSSRLDVTELSNSKTTAALTLKHSSVFDSTSGSVWRLVDIITEGTRQCGINLLNYNTTGTGQYDITDRLRTGLGFSVHNENGIVENALAINKDGYVGIGNVFPAQKLDVAGRIRGDTMEMDSYMYHVGDDNTYLGFPANDTFTITTSNAERLRVDSGGNVGIGTTNPNAALHVKGGNLKIENTGSQSIDNKIIFAETGYNDRFFIGTDLADSGAGAQHLRFGFTTSGDSGITNSNVIMDISGSGNVGIGTTSPAYKLDVNGSVYAGNNSFLLSTYSATGSSQYFGKEYSGRILAGMEIENTTLGGNYSQKLHFRTHSFAVSEGIRMTIAENGNVGIGTDAPGAKLDTRGDAVFDTGKDDTTLTGLLNYSSTQDAIDAGIDGGTGSIAASTDIDPPPGVAGDVIAKFVNSGTGEVYTGIFSLSPMSMSVGDVFYIGLWVYATQNTQIQYFKTSNTFENAYFDVAGNSKWTWYESFFVVANASAAMTMRLDNNNGGTTYYFTGFTIRKNPSQNTGLPFTPKYSPASGRGPVLSTQTLVARDVAFNGEAKISGLTYGLKLRGTLDDTKTSDWYRLLVGDNRNGANGVRTSCKLLVAATGLHHVVTFDFNHMVTVSQSSGNIFNLYGSDHYVSRNAITKLRIATTTDGKVALDMLIDHDVVAVSRDWTIQLYVDGGSLISAPTTFLEKITSTPTDAIELDITTAIFAVQDSGETTPLCINEGGNVGIGTASPENSLHIYKAATDQLSGLFIEKANGASGTAQVTFGVNDPSENPGVAKAGIFFERTLPNGRGDLKFCVDNANDANNVGVSDAAMTIYRDGNVGVGYTNPSVRLHVNGDCKANEFIGDNPTSGDGDDYAVSSLANDYSAWTSIFHTGWVGGSVGWGTFWAGNAGAAYRRVDADPNPNEYVFVGGGNKRFTFTLDDGQAYFDGGLSQNAYDYAEYFEWEDGNPDNEDRRGYSVVLGENGKIKKATNDDEPADIFGIVSGTSGVVGDAACYDWQGKYEVDEWGTRVTDEVYQLTWTENGENHSYDEDRVPEGVTVPESGVSRRLYNRERITPGYDDTKVYIPRDKRKEWCTVGLLGKVRLRDGCPKNPNWRYMKTIAGKELWLIR